MTAVWLAPIVTALHFLEEAPRFAAWARRHLSKRYSAEHWRKIHGAGMAWALACTAMVAAWPRPATLFLFVALYLAPMVFNMVFHAAATYFYRSYSPGT